MYVAINLKLPSTLLHILLKSAQLLYYNLFQSLNDC